MYLIKSGEKIIYDSRDKNTYPVIKPSYNEGLNEAGTLTFTLFPGHPYHTDMKKMQTFITAYKDDTEFFYGRVLITDKELDGRMEVTCEGGLTFLLDSEIEKGNYHETIEAFFRRCIAAHNSQVEKAKQFSIGIINAKKALDKTKEYDFNITSYTDIKSTIESMITGRFGGYVRIRPDGNGGHCIDYLEDYGRINSQLVKIGHNIIDKSDHISGENIFTILRPIGRSQPTGKAGENTDVTIESMSQSDVTLENVVKDGKLLKLTDKIELYGNIIRTEQFNSAETPADLLKKAEDYIRRRGTQLPAVCEINFIDFYNLNHEIMDVRLGDTFLSIEGFDDQVMTVGEISLDLEDPGNDTFRLKNQEEINANRLDYNVESGGKGGGSSSSLSSSTAKKNGQDNFRYKYYHEQDEFAKIATKQVEIAAEEHFSAISNKMYLTVMEKEGEPGEFVLQALSKTDDPNGATLIMNVDGFTLRKKAGYDKDGETILENYASTSELNVEKGRITALAQSTDALDNRVSSAEVEIDGMNAKIALKANQTDVDDLTSRVSQAEIDIDGANAQIALKANQTDVDDLTSRVSQAEIDIDGANAQIALKANQTDVDDLTSRVSQAEIDIDGANAQIALKASQSTVDALGERVSQAEIDINGAEAQIALKVNKGNVSTQLAIECGNVTVSGGNLVVSGYITSQGLITAMGSFSGPIVAPSVTADAFYLGRSSGEQLVQKEISMGTLHFTNSFVVGTGTSGQLDIGHYHEVTFSDGKFTIGGATGTAPGPFDITATTWYKNKIAAAWTNAYNTVRINNNKNPGAGDKTINLGSGQSVEVYAQAKSNANASIWTTVGTVTVKAPTYTLGSLSITDNGIYNAPTYGYTGFSYVSVDVPTNPAITQCYIPSNALSNVTVTAKSQGRYNVTGNVTIRVDFSDGTHTTYGPYTVHHYD